MNDDQIRIAVKDIHDRLHNRQVTHEKVSKHSQWTREEFEGVLQQDVMIFEDEMLELIEIYARQVLGLFANFNDGCDCCADESIGVFDEKTYERKITDERWKTIKEKLNA